MDDDRPGSAHYVDGDVVRLCMLPGCAWTYVEPSVFPVLASSMEDVADAVNRAFSARVRVVEDAIRDHAESHTAEDYWRGIATLRQALGDAAPGHPLPAETAPADIPSVPHLRFM